AGALGGLVAAAPASLRRRILRGPDLRGFLSEAETWCGMLERSRPGADPARLFDLVARTEHLTDLVPEGRLDREFPARARRLARMRLGALEAEASALILGVQLALPPGARVAARGWLRLAARADPDQGRPACRIDLGAFGGAAGALTLRLGARGRGVRAQRAARALLLRP